MSKSYKDMTSHRVTEPQLKSVSIQIFFKTQAQARGARRVCTDHILNRETGSGIGRAVYSPAAHSETRTLQNDDNGPRWRVIRTALSAHVW